MFITAVKISNLATTISSLEGGGVYFCCLVCAICSAPVMFLDVLILIFEVI